MCSHTSHHKKPVDRRIERLQELAKALHCPTRWKIIAILGSETATTSEIRDELHTHGYEITQSCLYYHLAELKNAELIEVAAFVEEGQGAPEKTWKLTSEQIVIDLIETAGDANEDHPR